MRNCPPPLFLMKAFPWKDAFGLWFDEINEAEILLPHKPELAYSAH